MSTETVVQTTALTKRFGAQLAVRDLNLTVTAGTVFGFLGPNGSGKTTTIRMLLGLAYPTSGQVELLGRPLPEQAAAVLPEVGALVEGPAHYPFLTGAENLRRLDALAGRPRATRPARVGEALERVGLSSAAGKKVKAYSLGMRQRLGLAGALLRPRRLLILDEPTNGLDPQGTREVRSLVRELAAGGTTVLLSSHLLAEVEQVCTHAGVMSAGRLLVSGSLGEIRAAAGVSLHVRTTDVELAQRLLASAGIGSQTQSPDLVVVALDGQDTAEVASRLVHGGVRLRGLAEVGGSLEEVFVSLTGEGFEVLG